MESNLMKQKSEIHCNVTAFFIDFRCNHSRNALYRNPRKNSKDPHLAVWCRKGYICNTQVDMTCTFMHELWHPMQSQRNHAWSFSIPCMVYIHGHDMFPHEKYIDHAQIMLNCSKIFTEYKSYQCGHALNKSIWIRLVDQPMLIIVFGKTNCIS